MVERPTESARNSFRDAEHDFMRALAKADTGSALFFQTAGDFDVAHGLQELSVGLRATYMLLEEVKGLLQRHGPPR